MRFEFAHLLLVRVFEILLLRKHTSLRARGMYPLVQTLMRDAQNFTVQSPLRFQNVASAFTPFGMETGSRNS